MAFDTAQQRVQALQQAGDLVGLTRTIYAYCAKLKAAKALYAANTDPAFNAAFNALFTTADRSELSTMITQLETLMADWEANHPWATT